MEGQQDRFFLRVRIIWLGHVLHVNVEAGRVDTAVEWRAAMNGNPGGGRLLVVGGFDRIITGNGSCRRG